MRKFFLAILIVVFSFFFAGFIQPVQAGCTGSTTCHYWGNCTWSGNGAVCNSDQRNQTRPGFGTCTCQDITGSSTPCSTCGIANGCFAFCGTIGTPITPGACEWTSVTCQNTYCGDHYCNGNETYSTCSTDCLPPAGTPVCGNGTCDAGESSSTCPQDCTNNNSCGSCSTCSYVYDASECRLSSDGICYRDTTCGGNCQSLGGCPPPCSYNASSPPGCKQYGVNAGSSGVCCDGLKKSTSGTCLCPVEVDCGKPDMITYTAPVPPAYEIKLNNNGQVVITWDREPNKKADKYQYVVVREGSTSPLCTAENYANCNTTTGHSDFERRIAFYPDVNGGNRYTVYVRGMNTTCQTDAGIEYGPWAIANFTITDDIDTEYYLSTDGSCSGDPVSPGRGGGQNRGKVTVTGGAGVEEWKWINSNQTTKTITVPYWPSPLGLYAVTLTPGEYAPGESYVCACPNGCVFNGASSPGGPYKFYVSQGGLNDLTNVGWFQLMNGNLLAYGAGGTAVANPIPVDTCSASASCKPYIIIKDVDNTDNSAGIAVTGGGSIDSSDEAGSQQGYITDRAAQAYAVGSQPDVKENYDYFYRLYSMGTNPAATDDFAGTANDARKPSGPPLGDKRAYFHQGNLDIISAWSVSSTDNIVIFVDGDLTISDPGGLGSLIDVEPGGFLAFIVSKNIKVSKDVGNENLDSTVANIEGVFIADGTFTVESKGTAAGGDERFVAEGTYVGWSGVDLQRDYSDGGQRKAENNDKPTETFVYRPDFVLNVPERMAKPTYIWQEAAP